MPIEAHITFIHKPPKDHTQVGNYSPMLLLNADVKIYAKILANILYSLHSYWQ